MVGPPFTNCNAALDKNHSFDVHALVGEQSDDLVSKTLEGTTEDNETPAKQPAKRLRPTLINSRKDTKQQGKDNANAAFATSVDASKEERKRKQELRREELDQKEDFDGKLWMLEKKKGHKSDNAMECHRQCRELKQGGESNAFIAQHFPELDQFLPPNLQCSKRACPSFPSGESNQCGWQSCCITQWSLMCTVS